MNRFIVLLTICCLSFATVNADDDVKVVISTSKSTNYVLYPAITGVFWGLTQETEQSKPLFLQTLRKTECLMQNLLHLTKNRAVLKCIRQTAVGSGCCLTLRRAICGMSIGAQKAMYCQKFQSQRQLIEVIKIKEAYNQLTRTQYSS